MYFKCHRKLSCSVKWQEKPDNTIILFTWMCQDLNSVSLLEASQRNRKDKAKGEEWSSFSDVWEKSLPTGEGGSKAGGKKMLPRECTGWPVEGGVSAYHKAAHAQQGPGHSSPEACPAGWELRDKYFIFDVTQPLEAVSRWLAGSNNRQKKGLCGSSQRRYKQPKIFRFFEAREVCFTVLKCIFNKTSSQPRFQYLDAGEELIQQY